MSERINLGDDHPELFQAVLTLEGKVSAAMDAAGIAKGFSHLLRLRASQVNQCAHCVRMHTRDALAAGESADRIAVVAAWRETDYFTPAERAALELTEAITLIADGQLPDETYARAAESLSPTQIAAVEWGAVVINVWNRLAISSRYPVAPEG